MRYSFVSFAQLLYPFEFLLGTRTCCFILSPFQYFKELICLILSPRFWGESGCKDKHFIPSYPNIFASFFKLFFQNCRFYQVRIMSDMFYKPILTLSRVESGCKFTRFFMNFQIIIGVFLKVYTFSLLPVWERTFLDNLKHWVSICQPPLSPPLLQSVVPDCGCKDKPISSPFPNFFTHFFKLFSNNTDSIF